MRILFVIPNPPSPIRVRSLQFARALRRQGHEITVATPVATPLEVTNTRQLRDEGFAVLTEPVNHLRRLANIVGAMPTGEPFQARYAWQPALMAKITRAVAEADVAGRPFDVAHIEHLRAADYGLALQPRVPVLWDAVDSITDLFTQAAAFTKSWRGRVASAVDLERTRRYEAYLVQALGEVVVTAESDRQALLAAVAGASGSHDSRGGPASVTVVPMGVDTSFFSPAMTERGADTLVFSGKFSYHANVTAARHLVDDIMPHVWQQRPDVRVTLAGAEPAREVRALGHKNRGRVIVTGYVDDLRPFLRTATIAVAPLVYAVGTQTKILEAMACATPVVATPIAVRALSAQPGRDLVIAEDPPAVARTILDLLADPARAGTIGSAGRAYVEREHRWDHSAQLLEAAYARAIARFRARQGP